MIREVLQPKGLPYEEVSSLEEVMPQLDILYMTRVQKERFFNEEDYIRLKDSYILTEEKMKLAKEKMAVLHPLPRVNEIELSVRAANCLNNANITTVGELAMKSEQEMLKYRNFGKKSLNEIKSKLEQLGLSLGMKIDERLIDSTTL